MAALAGARRSAHRQVIAASPKRKIFGRILNRSEGTLLATMERRFHEGQREPLASLVLNEFSSLGISLQSGDLPGLVCKRRI
jgi:hypothetical protein